MPGSVYIPQGDDHDRLLPSGNYNRDFTRPDRNYNPINSLIPVPLQPNKYVRPLSPHRYLHGSSYPATQPTRPLYRYKMTKLPIVALPYLLFSCFTFITCQIALFLPRQMNKCPEERALNILQYIQSNIHRSEKINTPATN